MAKVSVKPGPLEGEIEIPPSKSHTIRALLFALMAKGKSAIRHPLASPDTSAMLHAIAHLGARIERGKESLIIEGVGGKLLPAEDIIQCGNSGQVLRFIGALSALSDRYTILTGDPSIRHNRPVLPLLDAIGQLGGFAVSSRLDGYAPIIIRGPIQGGKAFISGEDSQPVSGLLILGAFAPLELEVANPGEKPWIELTLSWFRRLGIFYEHRNFEYYRMKGDAKISSFEYTVPGDFSSAAFPIGAALATGSELTLGNIDMEDPQGDKALIPALEKMGVRFAFDGRKLRIEKKQTLRGGRIDINDFIDALPILAVIGCFAEGPIELFNGAIARKKESDRIHCIALELKKMGADIEERGDGLMIRPSKLQGAENLQSHHDHRLAMALSIAALGARGNSAIDGVECVEKSYPSFFTDFIQLGARWELG